jgi:hypothetical protein
MHVVMRQNLVPRISFHAKFEVAVPKLAGNALLHKRRRHMIVEFFAAGDGVSQRGEKFARSFEDFGNWINESPVIARLMSFDWRSNRCHDVRRTALFREKDLNARACGLYRFDKDQFVFVRNDHGAQAASLLFLAACRKLWRRQAADAGGRL